MFLKLGIFLGYFKTWVNPDRFESDQKIAIVHDNSSFKESFLKLIFRKGTSFRVGVMTLFTIFEAA